MTFHTGQKLFVPGFPHIEYLIIEEFPEKMMYKMIRYVNMKQESIQYLLEKDAGLYRVKE